MSTTLAKPVRSEIVKQSRSMLTISIDDIENEMSPKVIWEHLSSLFATSVDAVRLMAACVKRLDELGQDTSHIKDKAQAAAMNLIRKVAYGTLLPEAVIAFELPAGLRQRLTRIPLAEQKKCVNGEAFTVYMLGGDSRRVLPPNMTPADIRQVFGPEGIRTEQEQIAYLHDQVRRETINSAVRSSKSIDIVVDKKNKCLIVNGAKIPARELARYLAEIAG